MKAHALQNCLVKTQSEKVLRMSFRTSTIILDVNLVRVEETGTVLLLSFTLSTNFVLGCSISQGKGIVRF